MNSIIEKLYWSISDIEFQRILTAFNFKTDNSSCTVWGTNGHTAFRYSSEFEATTSENNNSKEWSLKGYYFRNFVRLLKSSDVVTIYFSESNPSSIVIGTDSLKGWHKLEEEEYPNLELIFEKHETPLEINFDSRILQLECYSETRTPTIIKIKQDYDDCAVYTVDNELLICDIALLIKCRDKFQVGITLPYVKNFLERFPNSLIHCEVYENDKPKMWRFSSENFEGIMAPVHIR